MLRATITWLSCCVITTIADSAGKMRNLANLIRIDFDDIAKHSHWPPRLLGIEPYSVRLKTETDVLREFDSEKWGELLNYARTLDEVSLDNIEWHHIASDVLSPYYETGAFYLATEPQMLDRHLDLYASTLRPYLAGATGLVELGAGYGSKILNLGSQEGFSGLPLFAAEYTRSGCELLRILAKVRGQSVAVGHCDFRRPALEGVNIPEGAVIFTSYAVHYVPELPTDLVAFISALRPKAVVNFEPCFEHYPTDTLHGLMCRRYVELNDYSRNLATLIEGAADRGEITARIRKNVLGSNPFLPISILEWAPVRN